jgi:hypothetical protein
LRMADYNYVAGSTGNAALMSFTKAVGGISLESPLRARATSAGTIVASRCPSFAPNGRTLRKFNYVAPPDSSLHQNSAINSGLVIVGPINRP